MVSFFNRHHRYSHPSAAWSVAYGNPTAPCCGSTTSTTENLIKKIHDDSAPAGSFFLPTAKKPGLILLKGYSLSEDQGLQNEKRAAEKRFFELLDMNNTAMEENKLFIVGETTQTKNNFKNFLRFVSVFIFSMLVINLFFATTAFTQTIVVTNPTSPWTVPTGVTSIKVEVWGGGGGGGGSQSTFGSSFGSGGGGGAYNVASFSVSSGQQYNIVIGTGGIGVNDGKGDDGTASSVSGPGGTVTANPGLGGNRRGGTAGAGGTGGTHSGGTGGVGTSNGAGGGGGAGNNGDGTDGSNTLNGTGGLGNPNSAPYTGGNGGAATTINGTGNNAGTGPGGGGAGARSVLDFLHAGGNGGAGQVVITYTICPAISASATKTDITCFNQGNGTITINVPVTGTAPFQYSIHNGGATYQSSNTFNNLPVGTYQIRVKDANGCESKSVQ